MKKYIIYILLALTILLFAICHFDNTKKTFVINGIKYSASLDGNDISSFPSKGSYEVNVTCENATCSWNYDKWVIEVDNIIGKVSCNIDFTTVIATNINEYLINLSGTTQGNGQIVDENGYRYEGVNPNNYILFNNELWRIVGVFDSASHGVSDTYLTKIIRNDSLGNYAFAYNYANEWSSANCALRKTLSGYYNASANASGYTGGSYNSSSGHLDFSRIGIQDNYRTMIESTKWYVGGYDGSGLYGTAAQFYTWERDSTKAITSFNYYATTYVGLLYISDYGYGPLAENCSRSLQLSSYGSQSCTKYSWLRWLDSWTVTPETGGVAYVFVPFSYTSSSSSYPVRPVVYLKSNVKRITGDGSIANPYIVTYS